VFSSGRRLRRKRGIIQDRAFHWKGRRGKIRHRQLRRIRFGSMVRERFASRKDIGRGKTVISKEILIKKTEEKERKSLLS